MTENEIALKLIGMMKPFGFTMRDTLGIHDAVRLRYTDTTELRWEWRNVHDFLFAQKPFTYKYQNDYDLHWMSDSFFDWLCRIHYSHSLATANTAPPPILPVEKPGDSFHKSIGGFLTAYPELLSCAGCSSAEELELRLAVAGTGI